MQKIRLFLEYFEVLFIIRSGITPYSPYIILTSKKIKCKFFVSILQYITNFIIQFIMLYLHLKPKYKKLV